MNSSTKAVILSSLGIMMAACALSLKTPDLSESPGAPISYGSNQIASQPIIVTESLNSISTNISTPEQQREFVFVRTLWFDVSTYTPTSDGSRWGKTFACKNFMAGGRYYDVEKPYWKPWTTVKGSIERQEGICAIPRLHQRVELDENGTPQKMYFEHNGALYPDMEKTEWLHLDRTEYKSGHWGHKYILKVPGAGWCWPRDRITKYDRLDVFRNITNKAAMKLGVQKLVAVEIWKYNPSLERED